MANSIREATVRYSGPAIHAKTLRSPEDSARILRDIVDGDEREQFVVIMLDARHKPTGYRVVSIGTISASLVDPKEIFGPALLCHAAAIVIGHNHPSGDPSPSAEDHQVTQRLVNAGKIMGIPVVDHVIVGNGSDAFHSFKQEGNIF